MEEKKFYVAALCKYTHPTIVESFTYSTDAQLYADLMTRNKPDKYIVLTVCYESQETPQAD